MRLKSISDPVSAVEHMEVLISGCHPGGKANLRPEVRCFHCNTRRLITGPKPRYDKRHQLMINDLESLHESEAMLRLVYHQQRSAASLMGRTGGNIVVQDAKQAHGLKVDKRVIFFLSF